MNTSPRFLSAAASATFAWCLLLPAAPHVAAQQFGGVMPVANPIESGTAPTPAPDAPAKAENPAAAAKPDPNAPTETEILASNGADFASKERIAVFKGDVRVNDPRFQLACDKLTVFLSKAAAGDADGKAAPAPGNTPPPASGGGNRPATGGSDQGSPGGGIDHAEAEGHVIIIQTRPAVKAGEEPKVSVGRAATADFDNKTGDMVLHGWPSVEQNGNTHVALAQSTVMTLHKDNSMSTVGPSRTVIKEQAKGDGANKAGAAPGASPGTQGKPGGKTHSRPSGAPQG